MAENEEFKRVDLSSGNFEISMEDNRRNWRVYNVPTDLISKYISYAKLHFDNEVWKVMELGLSLILDRDRTSFTLEDKVKTLENEIAALKSLVYSNKEKEVCTFGTD
jgi:hypothetical protein